MKRLNICLPMAALILTAALAIPAAAQTPVLPCNTAPTPVAPPCNFNGTFQGFDEVTVPPEGGPLPCLATICTYATGTGTLLGPFSLAEELTVNFADLSATGSARWTANNGDILYTTSMVSAIPGPVVFTITEVHRVTGGTGRFAGAQGSFTVYRTHVVAQSQDGTHVVSGGFHGTIFPGAAH
jgi:hypothetical protein